MYNDDSQLEIGGHAVCPGGKVNVCWMGTWYTGTVLKIGPQTNLCKVIDPITFHTFLADQSQLKFMQTQILDREFTKGAQVCYNDGEGWVEGIIENTDAVGSAFVTWRKSLMSEECENWFEATHIGPIIINEAYRGGLQQSDRGPLPFESHRSKTNLLYESDEESEPVEYESPISKRSHSPKKPASLPTSPTYETIPQHLPAPHHMPHTYDVPYPPRPAMPPPALPVSPHPALPRGSQMPADPHPLLPVGPPHPTLPMGPHQTLHQSYPAQPFPMAFPRFIPYGQRWIKRSPSALSAPVHRPFGPSQRKHPLHPTAKYTNGIPPHHSSKFFKQLAKKKGFDNRQMNSPAHFAVKPSPTLHSVTYSEPIPFTHALSRTVTIPRRPLGKVKASVEQPLKRQRQTSTNKKKKLPQMSKKKVSPAHKLVVQEQVAKPDRTVDSERDTPDRQRKKGPIPEVASESPPNLHVFTGGRILITCVAKSDSPVTYLWLKNGQPLSETATNIEPISPGILDIQASVQDKGKYSCIISNEYGSTERDFDLQVTEAVNPTHHEAMSPNPTSQDSFTNLLDNIKNEMDDLFNENGLKSFHPSTSERPPGDGMESEASDHKRKEFPEIVVSEPQRRRISSVLKNDMEQYLGGYGQDYGVTSSATNLEMEGLKPFKSAEIHKSLKSKDKSYSKRNKYKRKWAGFGKKRTGINSQRMSGDKHGDLPESDQHLAGVQQRDTNSDSETISIIYEDKQSKAMSESNSIAVNTSLGSDHSVCSRDDDTPHVVLPLEVEPATEQIKRLQISNELYGPQSEKGQKVKKKSFLAALLSRNS